MAVDRRIQKGLTISISSSFSRLRIVSINKGHQSDNILLTDHLNAKVADFGLSISFSDDKGEVATQVKGTLEYLDPEYYMIQILIEKSDVYNFRVVMLELVTGKLSLEKYTHIVRIVRDSLKETGSVYNLVDPAIRSGILIDTDEFVNLTMKCLEDTRDERPSINEVVKEIESIIEASNINYDVKLTTTSASFDVTSNSGFPYISNGSMDSRMSSPCIK